MSRNYRTAAIALGGVLALAVGSSSAFSAEGAVTKTENEGRQITIDAGGTMLTVDISKSRTKVMINGAEADRAAVQVGMTCMTDVANSGDEAKMFDCK